MLKASASYSLELPVEHCALSHHQNNLLRWFFIRIYISYIHENVLNDCFFVILFNYSTMYLYMRMCVFLRQLIFVTMTPMFHQHSTIVMHRICKIECVEEDQLGRSWESIKISKVVCFIDFDKLKQCGKLWWSSHKWIKLT